MLKRFFLSERNMMVAIALNAIVICALYFPALEHESWLVLLDHFFLSLFVIEAIVKLSSLKPAGYFGNRWNQFDFLIVVLSLPTLLENFFPLPNTSLLLVLRMFRLVRLIRFIRFIPHLGMIMQGLVRAIKSSVFVLLALFFLNFVLALFTCHFYRHIAPEFFGNPLISAYSIFQMFTVEGWNEIPALIAERLHNPMAVGLTRFYFVVVVLVGGIFGMSLANAIFVDEMTMDNTRALEDKIDTLQAELRE
ncbi:MAG: ion transporter, partial [Saprospiraceae bacterium]|nr:ion transporter [Saprospiraceae bacterium]MCB0681229.1 ion transporter [Saprospiraceae bacterium]